MLHVDVSRGPNAEVLVAVVGEVDPTTAGILAEELDGARRLAAESTSIVVDFTRTRRLGASGVAVLLAFGRECERHGLPLRVVAPDPRTLASRDAASVPTTASAPRLVEKVDRRHVVAHTLGVLMADLGLDEDRARSRLAELARRAGVDLGRVEGPFEVVSGKPVRPAAEEVPRGAPRPLRIDFVAASWEIESTECRTHITDLAATLTRLGHEVTLHLRRDSPGQPRYARTRRGYRLARVPAGPPVHLSELALLPCLDEFAFFLDRDWAERVPDVVHLHSWPSALAVRERDAPLVQSFHRLNSVEPVAGGGRADMERLAALAADHVIASCTNERTALVRAGVPKANVSVVPWGVDTARFSPDGLVAARGTAPRVIALGTPGDHLLTVVEAVAGVPDVELLIAGPLHPSAPDLAGDLDRHCREHRVTDRTHFLGWIGRDELPAFLRSADVAVHVPRHEPSGIAVLQAMACGVPVIASAVGALTDIVVDGPTGGLVPPRAPVALGRALRRLLDDPIRREHCAAAGVDRVRSLHSLDRIAAGVVNAYHLAEEAARASRGVGPAMDRRRATWFTKGLQRQPHGSNAVGGLVHRLFRP